ncbi:MAG: hypothetical protein JNL98_14330 [Bryobacterales bacterium]|nr:hypothetical protein [Bryobacterales bacterium]
MRKTNQSPAEAAALRVQSDRFENFRKRHHATLRPANVVEESLVEIMALENWRRQDTALPEKARDDAAHNFQRALKSLTRLRRTMGRGPMPPLPTLRQRKPFASAAEGTGKVIEMPQPAQDSKPPAEAGMGRARAEVYQFPKAA